jgi:protein TonB
MANELLNTKELEPEAQQDDIAVLLSTLNGDPLRQAPIWRDIAENFRETLFPKKLPPLVLTSKPVAVIDIQKGQINPKATITSIIVYAALVGFFILLAYSGVKLVPKIVTAPAVPIDIGEVPPLTKPHKDLSGGGGGGSDATPATRGKVPPASKTPIAPPVIPKNPDPKLAVKPTIVLPPDMKFDTNAMNFGDPNAPRANVPSLGSGGGGGIGQGHGAGLGEGHGGGMGGGAYRPGGGVSRPVPIYTPEAEYSDEARRMRYQGDSTLMIVVDEKGNVIEARVLHPIGMGLDDNAKKVVMTWKFKPGMFNGKPVKVEVPVIVEFHLY